jgi:NitT/TauT family transport system substrate-binding protein
VALAKGYFKAEGLNITGLISSAGGGTTLRNMLAGSGSPYGEVNPVAVVTAVMAGADLRIVSDNVLTVAEFVWAVRADSPIKTIKDLKGKKMGYTNPRSTSQALANLMLERAGYKSGEVELVKTGGFGEGVAALESGLVDIVPITEPLWSKYKSKFRAVVVASDSLPPLGNVVGVTTAEHAEKNGEFIRAVIRARRKAVIFMLEQPDEAAEIVAKQFNIERDVAKSAILNLTKSKRTFFFLLVSVQLNVPQDATSLIKRKFLPKLIQKIEAIIAYVTSRKMAFKQSVNVFCSFANECNVKID